MALRASGRINDAPPAGYIQGPHRRGQVDIFEIGMTRFGNRHVFGVFAYARGNLLLTVAGLQRSGGNEMADAAFHIKKEPAVLNQEERGNKEYGRQLSHIGKIMFFVKNAVKR